MTSYAKTGCCWNNCICPYWC